MSTFFIPHQKLTVKGEIARAGADKLAEEAKKKGELLLDE